MTLTVLLGAPGAGKGTVAARVAGPLGARHVSTGEMLRAAVRHDTPAGRAAKGYMDRGELVPDAVLAEMIGDLLAAAPADVHVLLDGFPRNRVQAELLSALAMRHGVPTVQALSIDVPVEVVLDRLGGRRHCPACGATFHIRTLPPRVADICDACGAALVTRVDDQPETIRKRLAVYDAQTAPLIDWYTRSGALRRVDGSVDADTVAATVLRLLTNA